MDKRRGNNSDVRCQATRQVVHPVWSHRSMSLGCNRFLADHLEDWLFQRIQGWQITRAAGNLIFGTFKQSKVGTALYICDLLIKCVTLRTLTRLGDRVFSVAESSLWNLPR